MSYLYLLLAVVLSAAMNVAGMYYQRNTAGKANVSSLFNCMIAAANLLCWGVLYIFDFTFHPYVLSYSLVMGVALALFMTGLTGALKHGSASITSFFKQTAFVLVSVWGLFFWNEKFTLVVGIGFALILVALLLCLLRPSAGKAEKKNTLAWIFYLLLLFFSNAACSIIQRTQQKVFYERHGSQLMFFTALIAFVLIFLFSLKEDKSQWKETLEENWHIGLASGVSCSLTNVFLILMAHTRLSTSFIYPSIAIGGVAISTIASVFLFRERLRPIQWLGLGIGAVAVFLLSI